MKRIISLVLILTLCFPAMPVMAQERTINRGGLTINIPDGFTSYTQEEAALTIADTVGNVMDDIFDEFNKGTLWRVIGGIILGLGSEAITDSQYSDRLEMLIYDDNLNYRIEIYAEADDAYDFDEIPYYSLRNATIVAWSDMISSEGYSTDKSKALMRYTSKGIPYIQIDGYSSSGCCRMAVIHYNGYEDVVIFISRKEDALSNKSIAIFNELMDSISISLSPNKPEGHRTMKELYGGSYGILQNRVELND